MAIEVGLLGPTPKTPELAHLDFVYAELQRLGYDAAVFSFESTLPNDKVGQASPDHDADVLVTNTENRVQKHYRSSSGLGVVRPVLRGPADRQVRPGSQGASRSMAARPGRAAIERA